MKSALLYGLARFDEASTYAGIAAILGGVGLSVNPAVWSHVVAAGMAAAGLIAAVVAEHKPVQSEAPAAK